MRLPRLHRLRIRSLKTRFGLWVAALILVALGVFGAYVYGNVGQGMRASLDDSLKLDASLAASTLTLTDTGPVLGNSTPEDNSQLEVLQAQGDTVRYLDARGTAVGGFGLLKGLPADQKDLDAARSGKGVFSDIRDRAVDRDYRAYTMPLFKGLTVVGYVQALHDLRSVGETLERLLAALLIGGAIIIVVVSLVSYLLARRALAPIDAITKTARRISAEDLSARLGLSSADDEVGRLASTFDDMLERLEDSFQRERRFTTDASHELRTPLAAMETILGVVRSERRKPAEYEQALEDLAEETARLRTLVEDLLHLARGARTEAIEIAPVDLSTLLVDVADALRPLADEKGLSLECKVEPHLSVEGDADSLIRLFLNLVENAVKFTERGGITVSAASQGATVGVDVADTGIGIPEGDLADIFERFHRVDQSRSTPGTGLGLSLALQIAENHGGTITVRSREGQGSTFTVTLKKEPF